jgi:hypothetical protein
MPPRIKPRSPPVAALVTAEPVLAAARKTRAVARSAIASAVADGTPRVSSGEGLARGIAARARLLGQIQ